MQTEAEVAEMMQKAGAAKRFATQVARRGRILRNAEHGATTLEVVLIALLFFTFFFGILDICRALYSYHFVSHAAREAVRFATVRGASCSGLSGGCPATQADIKNYVVGIAPPGINTAAVSVTALCGPIGSVTSSCTSPNNQAGNMVKVKVQYTYGFVFEFVGTSIPMKANSQMVISQ